MGLRLSMPKALVAVDLAGELGRPLTGRLRAAAEQATVACLRWIQAKWQEAAAQGIDGLKGTGSTTYRRGIDVGLQYPHMTPLQGRVVNLAPDARRIEDGYPARDMKPALLSGPQVRMGKNGPYNIVPFRWGTPREEWHEAGTGDQRATLRSMPASIAQIVSGPDFTSSRRTDIRRTPAVFPPAEHLPAHVKARKSFAVRRSYEWGDRLAADQLPEGLREPLPGHAAPLFAGMVRMEAGEKTRKRHSHYMTFRAVSTRSDPSSWWHPGQRPRPFSKRVAASPEVVDGCRAIMRKYVGKVL